MIVATSVIAAVHRGRTLLARERLAGRICIGLSAALGTAAAIAIRIDIAGGDVPTSVSVTIATLLAATLLAAMVLIMTYGAVGVLVEHSDLARAASQTAGDEVVQMRAQTKEQAEVLQQMTEAQRQVVAELARLRAAAQAAAAWHRPMIDAARGLAHQMRQALEVQQQVVAELGRMRAAERERAVREGDQTKMHRQMSREIVALARETAALREHRDDAVGLLHTFGVRLDVAQAEREELARQSRALVVVADALGKRAEEIEAAFAEMERAESQQPILDTMTRLDSRMADMEEALVHSVAADSVARLHPRNGVKLRP